MDDQHTRYLLCESIVAQPVLVLGGDESQWTATVAALQQELSVAVADTVMVTTIPSMTELRTILQRIALRPAHGTRSLVCFYQVDRWSAELATVLLKTIEEPPAFAMLGLFAAGSAELLATIRSRVVVIRLPVLSHSSSTDAELLPQTDSLPDQFRATAKLVEAEHGIDTVFEQWLTRVTDTRVLGRLLTLRTTIGSTPINRRLALEAGLLVQRAGDTLYDR